MVSSLPHDLQALRLMTKMELMTILAWSEASIDRRLREDPDFPTPLRLGRGSIRWRSDEIVSFIKKLPRAYDYGDGD
jgi:predicted DNA-binding transcriptional regulator AlpA